MLFSKLLYPGASALLSTALLPHYGCASASGPSSESDSSLVQKVKQKKVPASATNKLNSGQKLNAKVSNSKTNLNLGGGESDTDSAKAKKVQKKVNLSDGVEEARKNLNPKFLEKKKTLQKQTETVKGEPNNSTTSSASAESARPRGRSREKPTSRSTRLSLSATPARKGSCHPRSNAIVKNSSILERGRKVADEVKTRIKCGWKKFVPGLMVLGAAALGAQYFTRPCVPEDTPSSSVTDPQGDDNRNIPNSNTNVGPGFLEKMEAFCLEGQLQSLADAWTMCRDSENSRLGRLEKELQELYGHVGFWAEAKRVADANIRSLEKKARANPSVDVDAEIEEERAAIEYFESEIKRILSYDDSIWYSNTVAGLRDAAGLTKRCRKSLFDQWKSKGKPVSSDHGWTSRAACLLQSSLKGDSGQGYGETDGELGRAVKKCIGTDDKECVNMVWYQDPDAPRLTPLQKKGYNFEYRDTASTDPGTQKGWDWVIERCENNLNSQVSLLS